MAIRVTAVRMAAKLAHLVEELQRSTRLEEGPPGRTPGPGLPSSSMVRLGIISDIHLELCRKAVPLDVFRMSAPDQPISSWAGPSLQRLVGNVDLVLLAGDIDSNNKGLTYANVLAGFLGVPVAYICGNHELYGSHLALPEELQRECFDCLNVHYLENERLDLEIDGRHVAVLGATLWTDFLLFGSHKRQAAMDAARSVMSDYRFIRAFPPSRFITPEDTAALHVSSRAWLETELASLDEDTLSIVLTHHAPSPRSVDSGGHEDLVLASYASNLEDLIESSGPDLWVHGHTHRKTNYRLHDTTVVSHPFGYPHQTISSEPLILSI